MTRVLFTVTVPVTAVAFLCDQLTELASQGWEVHLATSPSEGFDQLLDLKGVTVHALPMKRYPSPRADLRSLMGWRRLIRDVQPEVIVASTPKASLLSMVVARRLNIPVRLYHVRGLRAESLEGLMRHVSRTSERLTIRAATDVLCDSASLRDALQSDGLLETGQGVVLGAGSCCGVDTEHFRPPLAHERAAVRQALGINHEEVVVGFVGRLVSDKGIPELITAVTAVRETNSQVRLALIGPLEDMSLQDSIKSAVDAGSAIASGPVDDPLHWYWAFDIFCLPSHREGLPISPLEAQACGLPVVTTYATGCVDSIEPGKTGLLVPRGDATALSEALATLVADAKRRQLMGVAAVKWVRESFQQSAVRQRTISYLEALVRRLSDSHDL